MKSTHKELRELLEDLIPKHNPEEIANEATTTIFKSGAISQLSISLKLPSARCDDCAKPCTNGIACLHRVASQTRLAELYSDPASDAASLTCATEDRPQNIADTGIESLRGFAVFPLKYLQDSLGIIHFFTAEPLDTQSLPDLEEIANIIGSAIFRCRAIAQRLVERLGTSARNTPPQSHSDIIGTSPSLQAILQQIDLVAPTNAAVLINGDSGTGKELIANAIHRSSGRADMQLVKTNCASIPRELYESEFFGHVRGAFTGAVSDKAGRFQLAHQGTLFLDEVGEIPLELQSKLLRVLQEGEYERIGDTSTRQADVRIVCATNRDLATMVDAGTFRRDLYYRLNVFPIELPPLRKRVEDIPILAESFIQKMARRHNINYINLSNENIAQLQSYPWPGNVRELQNVIERSLIAAHDGKLQFFLPKLKTAPTKSAEKSLDRNKILVENEIREFEIQNTLRALEFCHNKIYGSDGAANLLGIKPTTLNSRLKKWGVQP